MNRPTTSLFSRIIDFEDGQGQMDEDETIEMFQDLIDTGMAWSLQGYYGRTAARLIEDGLCHPAEGAA